VSSLPVKQHLLDGGVCRVGFKLNLAKAPLLYCEVCIFVGYPNPGKRVYHSPGIPGATSTHVWIPAASERTNYRNDPRNPCGLRLQATFVFRLVVMTRKTSLAAFISFSSVATLLALAQDGPNRPSPPAASDVLGPQLIVWSETQRPEPLQQSLTEVDRAQTEAKKPSSSTLIPPQSAHQEIGAKQDVRKQAKY
jgi:hypothetical protein